MTDRHIARCPRCACPVPVIRPRLEHLRMMGWRLFAEASFVAACGHQQEHVMVPELEGEYGRLVPIVGEAA